MAERQRCRRNILQTLNDSELMKRYRSGIMFVDDLVRGALTYLLPNAITLEMKLITTQISFDIW